ncbi:MAG TPA: cation:proton antiporter [Thermoplasmata archaeon]|nr:cation:proton antiporter [Thermoplasmata archaeon]
MDPTTEFIVGLFLLVALSIIVGEVLSRFGIAALVGQILVGVVLGPTLLGNFLGLTSAGSTVSTEFQGIQFLATFFILMMAGLAVTPAQIRATGPSAAALGVAIFLVPFVVGAGIVRLLYPAFPTDETLFVSLCISITALPVLGIMLQEFRLADTRFGAFLMNGSVVNELVAVTVFAVLLRLESGSGNFWLDIAVASATVGVFLSTILAVHMGLQSLRNLRVWDRWVDRFRLTWRSREAGFGILMVAGLGAALYSQFLGLTFIVGAFYAGLLVTPESAGRAGHRTISLVFNAITWGFFIPLFFALVGFGMNFTLLGPGALPVLAFAGLAVFAFFSKAFVGTAFTRTLGWSSNESLCAGMLVSSRGAVELAMAVILLQEHIFTTTVYTIVAGVGLLTTLFSPIAARPFVRSITAERRALAERGPALSEALPPHHLISDGEILARR